MGQRNCFLIEFESEEDHDENQTTPIPSSWGPQNDLVGTVDFKVTRKQLRAVAMNR